MSTKRSPADDLQEAVAHHQSGRRAEAEQLYRAILRDEPAHPDANHNLGVLAAQAGNVAAAIPLFIRAIRAHPYQPQYRLSLIQALFATGQADAAQQALAEARRYGFFGGAFDALRARFAGTGPADPASAITAETHHANGNAHADKGQLDAAIACYRRALALRPDYAEAYGNLGNVLADLGRLDEAIACYRQVASLRPELPELHNNLGVTLNSAGRHTEAVDSFRQALALRPDFAEAHNNLGLALQHLGQDDEAMACFRRALASRPDFAEAHSNLLFLLAAATVPAADYLAEARQFEQRILSADERRSAAAVRFVARRAGDRLRIGYVSGDFRNHAVSYFIEQVFAAHDRQRISLHAYSTNPVSDAVTARLQEQADTWTQLSGLSDAEAAQRIRADSIDVLVDLSGHTADNRLGILARRAAPVQAHYLGYFASTGLSEMDYWIGDAVLTPPENDAHFSEQVWRLPRVWISYDGKAEAPAPRWSPAEDGRLRIGSFNSLKKLTPQTFALWARVLDALPEASLLLKAKELADPANRARVLETLAGFGIAAGRIELADWTTTPNWVEHMAYHQRLDVALDPVGPFGSGTTACDALWMGVPLITLAGDRMASRMSDSMLHAIGHPEWVAGDEDDYVNKVVDLAGDPEQRQAIRLGQRQRMRQSPLCDARGLATALEDAYASMLGQRLA